MADAICTTLQRLGLEGRMRQHDLWRVWPQTVGPEIAQHAQPHSLWHGRLVVHVSDPVWLYQLRMMRHRLLAALNERLRPAEIREIVLRIGDVSALPVGPPPQPPRPEPVRAIDPAQMAQIDLALASLGDAPFRDALRQLWLRAVRESASTSSLHDRRHSG
jgi:hypothetical protein